MEARTSVLLIALGSVSALAVWYYRNRASGKAGERLEEVVTTAQKITDAPLYTNPNPSILEEIAVTARKVAASVVSPGSSGSGSTSGVRGLRNNNPGNIRKSADKWQGLAPVQDDPSFFKFTSASFGVRALGKILQTYRNKYGLQNVRDIIGRWAPPNENNTTSYVSSVARALGVSADEPIDVYARLPDLAAAIIRHENGSNPYTAAEIKTWVYLP